MPPLRPLAPYPQYTASTTHTRQSGSRSRSRIAVQSPVKPPPTITTSAVAGIGARGSGAAGSDASASSSHSETYWCRFIIGLPPSWSVHAGAPELPRAAQAPPRPGGYHEQRDPGRLIGRSTDGGAGGRRLTSCSEPRSAVAGVDRERAAAGAGDAGQHAVPGGLLLVAEVHVAVVDLGVGGEHAHAAQAALAAAAVPHDLDPVVGEGVEQRPVPWHLDLPVAMVDDPHAERLVRPGAVGGERLEPQPLGRAPAGAPQRPGGLAQALGPAQVELAVGMEPVDLHGEVEATSLGGDA